MEILSVGGCPYERNEGEILNLHVSLDETESISLGDTVKIELMDDSVIEREVVLLNPKYANDYEYIYCPDTYKGQITKQVSGKCLCTVVVMNVAYHDVKTEQEISSRRLFNEVRSRKCLTPYKELHWGKESIFDYIDPEFVVCDKVIQYLQTDESYLVAPGIYEHPFIPSKRLLGPYSYTDGQYYWDRDTWKYVVKYHLKLPKEFIDHVLSDKGTEFIKAHRHGAKLFLSHDELLAHTSTDSTDIPLDDF